MTNNQVTFSQFDRVLQELGFERNLVPGSHVTYRHPESKALLMVRLHKPGDFVPDYVMASARLELEWKNVIPSKDFEAMLHAAAA